MSDFQIFFKLKRWYLSSWGEPILGNAWIIRSPLLYFNIKRLKDPNSLSFVRFQCILNESAVLSPLIENLKIQRRDLISKGEPILQNSWIIWFPLLYFNSKHLKDSNFSSFIRFQCILHDSTVLLSDFEIFFKLKRRDLSSWEGTNFAKWLNYLSLLLFLNIKHLKDANSSSFIRFEGILHDSVVLLSAFQNFLKLKSFFLISWEEPIVQNGWIIWSPLLYFNIKHLKDANSSSFIRFQCILHDSGVLLLVFENFLKLKRGDLIS